MQAQITGREEKGRMEACLTTRKAYSSRSSPVWSLGQINLHSILNISLTSCIPFSYLSVGDNNPHTGGALGGLN